MTLPRAALPGGRTNHLRGILAAMRAERAHRAHLRARIAAGGTDEERAELVRLSETKAGAKWRRAGFTGLRHDGKPGRRAKSKTA